MSSKSPGVIGRESPQLHGSGRSPQWIWSLSFLCTLHLFTSLLEITRTSLLEMFERIAITGGSSYGTIPKQMKFFATFRRVSIFWHFFFSGLFLRLTHSTLYCSSKYLKLQGPRRLHLQLYLWKSPKWFSFGGWQSWSCWSTLSRHVHHHRVHKAPHVPWWTFSETPH